MAKAESGRLTAKQASEWGTVGTGRVERRQLLAALNLAVMRKVTASRRPPATARRHSFTSAERPLQPHRVAFVTVRRGQRDEQLFWLALLQTIRGSIDEGDASELLVATPGFHAEATVDRALSDLAG